MKVVLVSGGSGGHLIPALALAEHLQKNGTACLMLTTARPMDKKISQMTGLPWETVALERMTPVFRWLSPSYARRQWAALRRVNAVLASEKPDCLVGFGGYLSAWAAFCARRKGIPVILHEQNLVPGLGNRLAARFAFAVAASFPETERYFKKPVRVTVTGNPVRHDPEVTSFEQARAWFGFDTRTPVLLIMGGSQGARRINEAMISFWEEATPGFRTGWQVIHLTGQSDFNRVQTAYTRLGIRAKVYPFLEEMPFALKAATTAVSRAGATGLAEMAAFGIPAVLIPYPHAGGHQRANAARMESSGGAVMIDEENLSSVALRTAIELMATNKTVQPVFLSGAQRRLEQLINEAVRCG